MKHLQTISEIDNTTTEGRYLMMALAKISTESQTHAEPDGILAQVRKMVEFVYPEPKIKSETENWGDPHHHISDLNKAESIAEINSLGEQFTLSNKIEKFELFEKEICSLINKHSLENDSNTPDYILANYLLKCLINFGETTRSRYGWRSKR